jgi:hypothetical protein
VEVPLVGTLAGVQLTATEVTVAAPLAGVVMERNESTVALVEALSLQSIR